MKKLLSILLALAMVMTFALPAMAEETIDPSKIPEGYPMDKSHAYDMTYYVGGYGAQPNRYQCSLDFGYENADGGIVSWYEWCNLTYGDPAVAEWPTEVGEYDVTIHRTVTVFGTEYNFAIPMKITVLELPATSGKCGDSMDWNFDKDSYTLTISGTGDMYTIAESTEDFWNEQYIYEPGWWKLPVKHVVVEEGVENLSNYAFFQEWNSYYKIHETIKLPTTLKAIPEMGFLCTTAMTSLVIPEGITSLTGWPFGSAGNSFTALTDLYLPSTLVEFDYITLYTSGLDNKSASQTLEAIHFAGAKEEWDAINRVSSDIMKELFGENYESIAEGAKQVIEELVVFEPKEDVKEEITFEDGVANVPDSSVKVEEGKDVVIDVTDMDEKAESVVLGSETVEKIADAKTAVEIKLPDVTVSFDKTAIGSIGQQAGNAAVTIVAKEIKEESLNDKQTAALKDQEVLTVLSLEAKAGETKITQFGGGKVTVSVPFELPQGKKGENFYVAYVAADGTITPMPTTYANGMLSFETTHFSNYVVLDNTNNPKDGDNGFMLAVLLMVSTGTALVCTKRKFF